MKVLLITLFVFVISVTASADTKQRIIEIEMKPLGEKSSRTLPVVKFPVVEGFSDWIGSKDQLSDQERFIELMVNTYSNANSVSEIEDIWDSRSFGGVRKMFSSDSDFFEKNSNYYDQIIDSKVLGVVVYGDYEVIFVTHKLNNGSGEKNRYYPTLVGGGKYVLSNEISNDDFFQYIISKLQEQLFERWSK